MKVAVIMNKNAKAVNDEIELTEKSINKKFKSLNIDSTVKFVDGKNLKEISKEFVQKNYDVIAAAGGDGTISSVASVLTGTEVPLAVLPFGTLNHFAKDLKIPLSFDEAAEIIPVKNIIRTDVGEVNGRIFINNSSIGFYPKIVRHRDDHKENLGIGKWPAMFVALINVFRRMPSINVKLHSDKESVRIKTPFVFIGNNEYQVDLFNLGTRKKLNEGKLYIYFPRTSGKLSIIKFAFLSLINKIKQADNFVIDYSDEIIIETKKKYLEVSADGELIRLVTPLHYKIKPLSLNVIIP